MSSVNTRDHEKQPRVVYYIGVEEPPPEAPLPSGRWIRYGRHGENHRCHHQMLTCGDHTIRRLALSEAGGIRSRKRVHLLQETTNGANSVLLKRRKILYGMSQTVISTDQSTESTRWLSVCTGKRPETILMGVREVDQQVVDC